MRGKFVLFFSIFLLPLSLCATEARIFLLDVSRSVSHEDFEKAKATIQQFSKATRSPDSSLVYIFGSKLEEKTAEQLNALEATESYTMLFDAVYDVGQELARSTADRKAILVFSDGNDTRSATISEDITSYAQKHGIAIYSVGIGKANRKVLERIAKLTGGEYFSIRHQNLIDAINSAILNQRTAQIETPKIEPREQTARPVIQSPPPTKSPEIRPATQTAQKGNVSIPWIAGILGTIAIVAMIVFIARRSKAQARTCPGCGKQLESYQTVCPDCTAETKLIRRSDLQVSGEGTQPIQAQEEQNAAVPKEWFEPSELTQEILSKTYVLIEAPILVVKSGKKLGESYSLRKDSPISIGRSRVNEIHLDDVSVSGQHCRIIPENENFVLHDLGSTNGTFLNNAKTTRAILKQGDVIKVGETELLYRVEQIRPQSEDAH